MPTLEHYSFRVLIIDHYDSYTNNLLQLLNTNGTEETDDLRSWWPVIIRYDEYKWDDFKTSILPNFDAIILSPGPGRPDNDADFGFNSQLIREADIPILGVCLGHQGIGTSLGAKIIHAPHIKHGQVSRIQHDGSGLFEGISQIIAGVQYNSLVLDQHSLPDELIPTAWAQDGEDANERILMGIRHRTMPIHGLQWHPESISSSHGLQIMNNFKGVVYDFWHMDHDRLAQRIKGTSYSANLDDFLNPVEVKCTQLGSLGHASVDTSRTRARHQAYVVKSFELGHGPSPEVVFEQLVRGATKNGEAWLDSAKSQDEYSRYSYLASGVFSLSYSTSTNCVDIVKDGQFLQSQVLETSFWEWFEHIQADIQRDVQALGCSPIEKHEAEMKATLQVGFMGYFGYEMKRESLPGYHWSLQKAVPDTCVPDAQFLFAQQVLRYDHLKDTWKLFGLIRKGDADPIAFRIRSAHSVGLTDEQFRCNKTNFKEAFSKRDYAAVEAVSLPKFECPTDSKSYMRSIALAKAAIKEGESYEMTLTTKFHARLNEINPFELYKSLRAKNPAPYSALLNFPATDVSILSSSPERFISISQHGVAEMKPIKGTLAVSKDPEEDSRRKHRLATDVKELAENLMIVDLIRSDLHRVSPTTSIKVPKLMQVESYETVHQLVTTIQSYIRPDVGTVKAIKSVFPPGSMTGAPKLRSVQILERLERNKERGVYSGCLGYICVSGAADQSVVIRTIVRKGNDLELGAGGAITWLSDPEKEWEEVLVKAKAVADIATTQSRADSLDPTVSTED